MGTSDLFIAGYPHGTPEGYDDGCRGGACPGQSEYGLSCKRAKTLSRSDVRYKRLRAEGKTPAEIAAIIDHPEDSPTPTAPAATPPAAPEPQEAPVNKPTPTPVPTPPKSAPKPSAPAPRKPSDQERAREELMATAKGRAAVRDWGRKNGFEVGDKGRISGGVVLAYLSANAAGPAEPVAIAPAEFAEALEQTRARVDDPERPSDIAAVPEVGMRARVRHDDGVAVVREIAWFEQGAITHVRVSFLPDPRDEDAWESIDWLDTVTNMLPADLFTYDRFGSDDMATDLDQWAAEGRIWHTEAEARRIRQLRDRDYTDMEPSDLDIDTTRLALPDYLNKSHVFAAPAPERPEWADITIPEDIESARRIAVHLEQELAEAERQRDVAQRSLEFTLQAWGAAVAQATDAGEALAAMTEAYLRVISDFTEASDELRGSLRENDRLRRQLSAALIITPAEPMRFADFVDFTKDEAAGYRETVPLQDEPRTAAAQHQERPAARRPRLFGRR